MWQEVLIKQMSVSFCHKACRYTAPGCCHLQRSEESKTLPVPLPPTKLKQHREIEIPGWSLRWQWPDRYCKKMWKQSPAPLVLHVGVQQWQVVLWCEMPAPAMSVPWVRGLTWWLERMGFFGEPQHSPSAPGLSASDLAEQRVRDLLAYLLGTPGSAGEEPHPVLCVGWRSHQGQSCHEPDQEFSHWAEQVCNLRLVSVKGCFFWAPQR